MRPASLVVALLLLGCGSQPKRTTYGSACTKELCVARNEGKCYVAYPVCCSGGAPACGEILANGTILEFALVANPENECMLTDGIPYCG